MERPVPTVVVIDDMCSFRRRAIAARSEYLILKSLLEDGLVPRANDELVKEYDKLPKCDDLLKLCENGRRILVIFLHHERQFALVKELTELWRSQQLHASSKVVTYTGGIDTPIHNMAERPYLHFNQVWRLGDCRGSSALQMLAAAARPRMVDEVLAQVFGELTGSPTEPSGGASISTRHVQALGQDAQHTLTNALRPLAISVEMAAQQGSGYKEVVTRWDAFIKACDALADAGDPLSEVMNRLRDEGTSTIIPHFREGRPSAATISRLSSLLADIEKDLYPVEGPSTDWLIVENVLTSHGLQPQPRVLWIEDDPGWKHVWEGIFRRANIAVEWLESPLNYVAHPEGIDEFDVVLLDVALPGCGAAIAKALGDRCIEPPIPIADETAGIGLLQLFRQAATAPPPIFMVSAYDSLPVIEACVRLGAHGYRTKHRTEWLPFFTDLLVVIKTHRETKRELLVPLNPSIIAVKTGDPLASVILKLDQFARNDVRSAVVLVGEAGVGKELLARECHLRMQRHLGRQGPFVRVDLGSLATTVFESELFGYEKGAFTGATQARPGLCEQADHGTLFLDEIDKLQPQELQWKLLSLLESDQRTIRRLGSNREKALDLKIIVASNEDPRGNTSLFPEPIASRLSLVVRVPSLRDRVAAIQELAQGLCDRVRPQDRPRVQLDPNAISWLARTAAMGSFPANLRSLKGLLERTLAYNGDATLLTAQDLQAALADERPPQSSGDGREAITDAAHRVANQLRREKQVDLQQLEKQFRADLLTALRIDLDRSEIAELFGTTPENLRQMIRQLRKDGFPLEDI